MFGRYCDGMAFAGNLTAPHVTSTGQRLWFRGLENLAGTFASLAKDHALGDATVVITNGASAGGHATWLHADRMTDMIHHANVMSSNPAATVVALPDSGHGNFDVILGHFSWGLQLYTAMHAPCGVPYVGSVLIGG